MSIHYSFKSSNGPIQNCSKCTIHLLRKIQLLHISPQCCWSTRSPPGAEIRPLLFLSFLSPLWYPNIYLFIYFVPFIFSFTMQLNLVSLLELIAFGQKIQGWCHAKTFRMDPRNYSVHSVWKKRTLPSYTGNWIPWNWIFKEHFSIARHKEMQSFRT